MKLLWWLPIALATAGCHAAGEARIADLSFSRAPGLGYRNAGLFPPGRLYLFDQAAATLTKLSDDIPLDKKPSDATPTTLTASNIRGIALSGDFGSAANKLSASLSVGSRVAFTAERAVRERFASIYSGLAKAYAAGLSEGQDMYSQWYVKDVTTNANLYYVVINDIVRADKAGLSIGGAQGQNTAELSVSVPGLPAPLRISIVDNRLAECSGASAPCFFDAAVIKPYIGEANRLSFRATRAANLDVLSDAFRKL